MYQRICLVFLLLLNCFIQGSMTEDKGEIRIALLGITGSGKSTLGNIFTNSKTFPTSAGSRSETKEVKSATFTRNGRPVKVVDTPGFFDTDMTFSDLQERIIPFLAETSPGPHVVIYVLHAGRHTQQEVQGIMQFFDMFGNGIAKFSILVFTKLSTEMSEQNYIESLHDNLKKLVEKCNSRYVFMPPVEKPMLMQSKQNDIFNIIEDMMKENHNQYYTDKMFQAQQKILKEKLEEQRQQQIKEKEKELAKVRAEVESQFEKAIKDLEEQVNISKEDKEKSERKIEELRREIESNKDETKNLQHSITIQNQMITSLQKQLENSKNHGGWFRKIFR